MEEGFDDWFYELEGFVFRAERFCDDVECPGKEWILGRIIKNKGGD